MNKSNSLISVIVPIYNTSLYLKKCISSILSQTYKNIEIILVNDGSTDNSAQLCLEICALDSRCKYIYQSNQGLSAARNIGVKISTGDYLAFIDSDDFVYPGFIEKLFDACQVNNSLISMCGRTVISDNDETFYFSFNKINIWQDQELIKRFLTWDGLDGSVCDKLFSRQLIEYLNFPLGRISEDIPIMFKILIETNRIVHVGEPLYCYYQRNGSITNSKFNKNKITMLDSSNFVRNITIEHYPDLASFADDYHINHILILRDLILNHEKIYPVEFNIIENELHSFKFKLLKSGAFKIKIKLKILLLLYFPFIYSLTRKIIPN